MTAVLIAAGIVGLRLIDVSIGALRITYLVRGRRLLAGSLGFFESLTWVIAAGIVLSNLDQWYKVIAYAGGFGLGTALGGTLDRWIASGQVMVRVMAPVGSPQAAGLLREKGFGVTVLNAEGKEGEVRLTLVALRRKQLPEVIQLVRSVNDSAYVTVDAVEANSVGMMRAGRIRK
ncbi:MAG: DUF5698 domain-containing protein [Acidimicrobiia bacterium]|nr:DUF5698 domain-containing protein [Acidimicrobiia bacterium]